MLARVKGSNGIVEVYENKVVISRKTATGLLLQGIKGDREIFFADIKSIEFKKATILANGYIQFITNAEMSKNQKVGLLGTSLNAAKDPNAVIIRAFNKQTVADSLKVYEESKRMLEQFKTGRNVSVSPADELRKFKSLLDDGIITRSDFDFKKRDLLK